MTRFVVLALGALIFTACTAAVRSTQELPTQPAPQAVAPTISASATPAIPTETARPFRPVHITTWADNVLLRANPGYLFPQLAVLPNGSVLLAFARTPGSEWLLAKNSSNVVGWVFSKLIDANGADVQELPVMLPADAQIVTGSVIDVAGVPIRGIQFALVQGAGTNAPRNDAMTDDTGTFYAFMPLDASGTWTVGYTAVACTSNTMDADCNCIGDHCGQPDPLTRNIRLPLAAAESLSFVWR